MRMRGNTENTHGWSHKSQEVRTSNIEVCGPSGEDRN